MALEESTDENDVVVTSGGVTVVYEREFDEYLSDARIDYSDSFFGKGFSVRGGRMGSC